MNEDDDPTPFIEVVYKKSRKAGIPVILKPVNPDESLVVENPNVIANEVLRATQEKSRDTDSPGTEA